MAPECNATALLGHSHAGVTGITDLDRLKCHHILSITRFSCSVKVLVTVEGAHRTAKEYSRLPDSVTWHLSRYSILTWKVREGLPYATAYHSPSAPIMKYTSCW